MRSFWRSDLLRLRGIDLDRRSGFQGADRACDACYEALSANLEAARPRDGLFFHTISILDLKRKKTGHRADARNSPRLAFVEHALP
jgi:hypothetical protein